MRVSLLAWREFPSVQHVSFIVRCICCWCRLVLYHLTSTAFFLTCLSEPFLTLLLSVASVADVYWLKSVSSWSCSMAVIMSSWPCSMEKMTVIVFLTFSMAAIMSFWPFSMAAIMSSWPYSRAVIMSSWPCSMDRMAAVMSSWHSTWTKWLLLCFPYPCSGCYWLLCCLWDYLAFCYSNTMLFIMSISINPC